MQKNPKKMVANVGKETKQKKDVFAPSWWMIASSDVQSRTGQRKINGDERRRNRDQCSRLEYLVESGDVQTQTTTSGVQMLAAE